MLDLNFITLQIIIYTYAYIKLNVQYLHVTFVFYNMKHFYFQIFTSLLKKFKKKKKKKNSTLRTSILFNRSV